MNCMIERTFHSLRAVRLSFCLRGSGRTGCSCASPSGYSACCRSGATSLPPVLSARARGERLAGGTRIGSSLNVVVDASAALEWFFRSRDDEVDPDIARAVGLYRPQARHTAGPASGGAARAVSKVLPSGPDPARSHCPACPQPPDCAREGIELDRRAQVLAEARGERPLAVDWLREAVSTMAGTSCGPISRSRASSV